MSSLASTFFIILGRANNAGAPAGIIVVEASPAFMSQAAQRMTNSISNSLAQTGPQARTAAEITLLADSAAQAAMAENPAQGYIKVIGSTLVGTAVGLAVTPLSTPVGGFLAGVGAGELFNRLFDALRDNLQNPAPSAAPSTPNSAAPGKGSLGVQGSFNNAERQVPRGGGDPLVLDMGGDGLRLIQVQDSQAHFDMDSNGFREKVGWISGTDAFLAFDKNNDGAVNDITELFGNLTTSGFTMLRAHDTNNDNKIDALDTDFSLLKIWQDANEVSNRTQAVCWYRDNKPFVAAPIPYLMSKHLRNGADEKLLHNAPSITMANNIS